MSDEKRITHESFGFIRASRISSTGTRLFDSAIQHQHSVRITIGRAEQVRAYSDTRVHGLDELISVEMSEAQFAQFITSMNVGSGAPCTLTRVDGKFVEPPPADINTRETFEGEVKERLADLAAQVGAAKARVDALIAKGKAGKGELQDAVAPLVKLRQELEANLPFMMQCFAENVEKLTERAKADINAHAVMVGQRLMVGGPADAMMEIVDDTKPDDPAA